MPPSGLPAHRWWWMEDTPANRLNPELFMNKLFIVGAGGMGREVVDLARALPACGRDWRIAGFLDRRPDMPPELGDVPGVVGDPFEHAVQPDERFVIAQGDSLQRLQIGDFLRLRGARFESLVHPNVSIGSNTHFGQGCIFYGGAIIGPNVTVGDFVFMNSYAGVGHDCVVGSGTTIGPQSCIGGRVKIGKGVYIGTNATVLPKMELGDHALIGAGSVVLRKVSARSKVFGNPAVRIGEVTVCDAWPAADE